MNEGRFEFQAIGTSWTIDLPDCQKGEAATLIEETKTRIDIFDKNYSRFRDDSLVHEISKKAGTYTLPDDAEAMLNLYSNLFKLTNGKVTPLIGQVLSDAGYDADYSLRPKADILPAKNWQETIDYAHPLLTTKEPILLDFGALGKGYLIDIVARILEENSVKKYTVNAGGDLRYRNDEDTPLRVGLENPENTTQVVGVGELKNRSLCGSAGNRRAWGNFHHIIDPDLVTSPTHISALWVIADSTLLADGLSTALFFVEPKILAPDFSFEYAILYSDHSLETSANFPGTFFTH